MPLARSALMITIGYHASHEQYAPGELLRHVQRAEAAGFTAAMCSDHFHPWTDTQGQSGHAWSWLGAALATTKMSFGVVNAPGYRYHPAVIAQAAATLAAMFPQRFWISVGSGEALNEHITGERWPAKNERNARLRECVDIMRALWAGETVSHHGLITVEEARLYSLPEQAPMIVGAALSPETAEWVGSWADALITTNQPLDSLQEMIAAFRSGGGADKPMFLQVQLSYAATDAEARRAAQKQWGPTMLGGDLLANLRTPSDFAAAGNSVQPEDVAERVLISADTAQHAAWLAERAELGFERMYLHNVNLEQERFIEDFAARVLPEFA